MRLLRIILVSMAFCVILLNAVTASGAVITSTAAGGRWEQSATWTGGQVPTSADDVIIDGSVYLYEYAYACSSLTVNAGDSLWSWFSVTLNVGGDIVNNGVIRNPGAYGYTVNVTGDVVNNGRWELTNVYFTGSVDQNVQSRGGNVFDGCYLYDADSTSSITVDSTLLLYNTRVDLQGGLIELYADPGIVLTGGYIKNGSVLASGAAIVMEHIEMYHEGYVMDLALSGAELRGYFSLRDNVVFYDSVTVTDTLINYFNEINYTAVEGDIRNNGTVMVAGAYGLYMYVSGDLINNGTWTDTRIQLTGTGGQEGILVNGNPLQAPVSIYAMQSGSAYQWYYNGSPMDGATDSVITADSLTANDYGVVFCTVDGDTSRIIILSDGMPQAHFNADVRLSNSPCNVQFADYSTGGASSWNWDFGDGGTGTDRHAQHVYTDAGTYDVTLVVSDGSDADTVTYSAFIVIADGDETFETGDFTALNWQHNGDSAWVITGNGAMGTWSALSGNIGSNQTSDLSVTLMVDTGAVSFYRTVSSESGYDKLEFYVDGVMQDNWSGEEGWAQVSYEVNRGEHTFLWRYKKDNGVDEGTDEAMIDAITFPVQYQTAAVSDTGSVVLGSAGVAITFIDSLTGSGDVGALLFYGPPPNLPTAGVPLGFYFSVVHDGGISDFTAVLTFSYDQAAFDSSDITDETSLYCARWNGTTWESYGTVVDTAANTVTCITSQFSLWAIGGAGAALPVELVSFAGTAVPGGISLAWETASEQDVLGFNVLRGITDDASVRINRQLVPAGSGSYTFIDMDPAAGENVYRLQTVNADGSTELSAPVSVAAGVSGIVDGAEADAGPLAALPVPALPGQSILLTSAGVAGVAVADLQGNVLVSYRGTLPQMGLTAPAVPGVYTVFVTAGGRTTVSKLIVAE